MYYGAGATDVVTTKVQIGIGLALLVALSGVAQLPPQVELDRLLLRAEQRIEEERWEEAVAALEEASRLADKGGSHCPTGFGSGGRHWRLRWSGRRMP